MESGLVTVTFYAILVAWSGSKTLTCVCEDKKVSLTVMPIGLTEELLLKTLSM